MGMKGARCQVLIDLLNNTRKHNPAQLKWHVIFHSALKNITSYVSIMKYVGIQYCEAYRFYIFL
jgi:hypothetical protein